MNPTLVPGTRFESQFQICVYEHAILRIYINYYSNRFYNLYLWNVESGHRVHVHVTVVEFCFVDCIWIE